MLSFESLSVVYLRFSSHCGRRDDHIYYVVIVALYCGGVSSHE